MNKIITDKILIDEILDRGTIIKAIPSMDELRRKLLSGKQLKIYIGFDATAPTLHLSHAKNIILLEKFRKLGHQVILLFGDFTARIGDPSEESSARKQLTGSEVVENIKEWKRMIAPLMDFQDKVNPPLVKMNSDWLSKLNFEDVVNLAANFTVQQILERDMFEKRMQEGNPIFLHEFLYPLMQGFDSVELDVDVELCGTDQTFNALCGRTLLKRKNGKEKMVVNVTLMENPKTGELMSKSKGIGVFLDKTPNDLFGQIMSQPDEMIEILFLHCTHISKDEIKTILKLHPKEAKLKLAMEITTILHNIEIANQAKDHFERTVTNKEMPDEMDEIYLEENEISLVDLLLKTQLVDSKSNARRLIEQNAIKINGEVCNSDFEVKLISDQDLILQKGKRSFIKIKKEL
ncbi:tyrosine--tRNA ligase [bacterium]|jgi:tyrosyl-tRNA synthetase|nr:tyrosine--tRNA ligase [bacterium]MBT6293996.1 tyrosine--tRNA ligase [bacterium]